VFIIGIKSFKMKKRKCKNCGNEYKTYSNEFQQCPKCFNKGKTFKEINNPFI